MAAGPQAYLLAMFRIASVMRNADDPRAANEDACCEMIEDGIYVDRNASLEAAMLIFDRASVPFILVVTLSGDDTPPELWGALFHLDALKAYNRALAATVAEGNS